jgi:uncharacterized damage-inducible protein DinB
MSEPEVWLRGERVEGVSAALQPVAHALKQTLEEVERAVSPLTDADLWALPGGAASVGFHLRHMAGSMDRLLAYARGEQLSDAQLRALRAEKEFATELDAAALLATLRAAVEQALDQLRATPDASLDDPREVGRGRLPSSVRGLLYHVGEHTARHGGQVVTTAKIVRGLAEARAS